MFFLYKKFINYEISFYKYNLDTFFIIDDYNSTIEIDRNYIDFILTVSTETYSPFIRIDYNDSTQNDFFIK